MTFNCEDCGAPQAAMLWWWEGKTYCGPEGLCTVVAALMAAAAEVEVAA